MLEILALLAALALCVWTPIETRKVRNGWIRKRFKGTPAEFVTAYRRQLAIFTWVGGVLGLGNIALAATIDAGDPRQILKIVSGAIWVAAAVVSYFSRRQLDVPTA